MRAHLRRCCFARKMPVSNGLKHLTDFTYTKLVCYCKLCVIITCLDYTETSNLGLYMLLTIFWPDHFPTHCLQPKHLLIKMQKSMVSNSLGVLIQSNMICHSLLLLYGIEQFYHTVHANVIQKIITQ